MGSRSPFFLHVLHQNSVTANRLGFEEGILEFDTASCGVRRNPTSREVNLGFASTCFNFFFEVHIPTYCGFPTT